MKKVIEREVRITGVPLDLGASRRGTDVGPSALRIAGLGAQLRRLGYSVAREEDIPAPAMETRSAEDVKVRFKPQILEVCTQLAAETFMVCRWRICWAKVFCRSAMRTIGRLMRIRRLFGSAASNHIQG